MRSRRRRRYRMHRSIERFARDLQEWYVLPVPSRWPQFLEWLRDHTGDYAVQHGAKPWPQFPHDVQ